jgi:hypothetical protein
MPPIAAPLRVTSFSKYSADVFHTQHKKGRLTRPFFRAKQCH